MGWSRRETIVWDNGSTFVVPEGWAVRMISRGGGWEEEPVEENVLVCGTTETPGDAPARCADCGQPVRVPRDRIALFGRGEPPVVKCGICANSQRTEAAKSAAPPDELTVQEKMRLFESLMGSSKDAAARLEEMGRGMRRVAEATARWEADRMTICHACGGIAKSGKRFCPRCERRAWRQRAG